MIRDFIPGDQDGLRHLVLAGLRERWGDAFDPRFNSDLEDIESNYVKRGAAVIVIDFNRKLVATGTLLPDGPDSGQIVRMSVAGPYRRKGLARRVVEELIARARHRGMSEVRVRTDTPWASAVELYRSCGFVEVASDECDTHFAMQL